MRRKFFLMVVAAGIGIASAVYWNGQSLPADASLDPLTVRRLVAVGTRHLQMARETGDPSFYSKAEEVFDRVLTGQPEQIDALVGEASLAFSRHHFEQSRDLARRAIDVEPAAAAPYGVLSDALIELGEYDEAVRTLQKMVEIKPNLSSYSRVAYVRELMGDIAGAETAMQLAIDAGAPDAENTAWCIVQLGNLYLNSSRVLEAEKAFQAVLERYPDYPHAYAGLAKVAIARGQFPQAADGYSRAIRRAPVPEFFIVLGELYQRMNMHAEAAAQFELVSARLQIYKAHHVAADVEMILFEADHGNVETALDMAETEWKRRKSIRVADAYAWALYRSGRLAEARQMMRQALRLGTKDPLLNYHAEMIGITNG
jgi:tetratricopeptide (TPR) repeat protein